MKIHAERSLIDFQSLIERISLKNLEIMVFIRSKQTRFQILVKFQIDQLNMKIQQQYQGWHMLLFNIRGTSFSHVTTELYLSPSIKNFLHGIELEPIPPIHENQELTNYVFAIKNCISKKVRSF